MASGPDIAALAAGAKLGRRPADVAGIAARLGRGKSLRMDAVWPGGTLPIQLQILTASERAQSVAAAHAALKFRGIEVDGGKLDPLTVETVAVEVAHQVVARAVLDAETGAPLFASAAELGAAATEDEIEALFNLYSDHRQNVDPAPGDLTDEEFRALDEAVKKKDVTRVSDIARSMPRRSLLTTVVRLASSLMDNSTSTPDSPNHQLADAERDAANGAEAP